MEAINKAYYVYIIMDQTSNRTYIGYTVNLKNRLRQHCGVISGGAKATKSSKNWSYLLVMTCDTWNASRAMQIEWLVKHPERKKRVNPCYRGVNGKINSLKEIANRVNNENIKVYIHDKIYQAAIDLQLPENFTIIQLQDLAII